MILRNPTHTTTTTTTTATTTTTTTTTNSSYRNVNPIAVREMQMRGDSVRIVDVREPSEFNGAELRHIAGAELVPLATIETVAKNKKWEETQAIVLVCRSGGRSGRASALLASMGFRDVMNMVGGMLAWNAARLPVE